GALATRCGYCGQSVKLAEASVPRPPKPAGGTNAPSRVVPLMIAAVVGALGLVGAALAFFALRPSSGSAAEPARQSAAVPVAPSAPVLIPVPEKSSEVRYPLRALLGVSTAIDVDGSQAHMKKLFPSVSSNRHADELHFVVPLSHPWFGEAELG